MNEVVRRNASVVGDYLQAKISQERIRAEEGIFEPLFETSLTKQQNHTPNTTLDVITRQQNDYFENVNEFNVGFNGKISSGATWDLKFVDRQRSSSIIDKYRTYQYEYDNLLKLSLGQPILKGFGRDTMRAKIEMAKVQSEIDDSKYEQKMMELVAVTIQSYWRLYGSQQICETWERSVKIAEDALKDLRSLSVGGKAPQTDLMEAESALSSRRAELYNASSRVIEAQNQLMTLLNVSAYDFRNIQFLPIDDPFSVYTNISDGDSYVGIALVKWPEYRIARKKVESERIQVTYSQNQLLPQLDLVGSVSLNSLDQDHNPALQGVIVNDFFSWSAGLKFSLPILDNAQARGALTIARIRARQAEVELDALGKSLANSLHSKIAALISQREQLREYEKGLKIRKQLLEIEQTKLKLGHISLKKLLDQEEEYVNYQRKAFSGVMNYKLGEATFEIAVGSILEKYNVDQIDIRRADRFTHGETTLVMPQRLEMKYLDKEAPGAAGQSR